MANSFTTNLVLTKPEVGADSNLWGGHLNGDLDILDGIFTSASTTLVSMVIKDDTKFVNATTTSKQIVWSLASINTTTPRTLTVPDFSGALALQAMMRSHLAGLTLSTAGGSGTFGVAAGVAADSTNVAMMILPSAFTKTTSNWAVGTGNGGLDTGVIANSTWYHVYEIQRVDTGLVDVLFSLSATSPTMPANYTLFRCIGSMLTDSSAHWTAFTQTGDLFQWATVVRDQAGLSTAGNKTLASVPSGRATIWQGRIVLTGVTAAEVDILTPGATSINSSGCVFASAGNIGASQVSILTNTSQQVFVTNVVGTFSYDLYTAGWIDRRGRDS